MTSRGSAAVAWLFVVLVFAGVVWACITLAPEPQTLMEQVENAGQWIGGVL